MANGELANKVINLRQVLRVRFLGVVVITSALHAEGLGFEPRRNLTFLFLSPFLLSSILLLSRQYILEEKNVVINFYLLTGPVKCS